MFELLVSAACAFFLTYGVTLFVSRRQRIEGGATRRRWFTACAIASAAVWMPFVAALVASGAFSGAMWLPVSTNIAMVVTILYGSYVIALLKPITKLVYRGGGIPHVEDEDVLRSMDRFRRHLGIAWPCPVFLRGTRHTDLDVEAGTNGLIAPAIYVTDGVLTRLSADERDAILIHELAHIAHRTVLRDALVVLGCMTAAVLMSAYISGWVAIPLGLALALDLRRVLGQRTELVCDLVAARLVGFAPTVTMLGKTHQIALSDEAGALTGLLHASTTHPSLPVRVCNLAAHAPVADQEALAPPWRVARRHRIVNGAVHALWVAGIILSLLIARSHPSAATWILVGLIASSVVVAVLVVVTVLLRSWRTIRYLPLSVPWFSLARMLAAVGAIILYGCALIAITTEGLDSKSALLALGGILLTGIAWRFGRKRDKRRRALDFAIRNRDFERAINLLENAGPKAIRPKNTAIDYANALWLTGRRADALAVIDDLARRYPGDDVVTAHRIGFHRDHDPALALQLANELAERRPRVAWCVARLASMYRRLGRLQDAMRVIDRALALDARDSTLHAIRAWTATGAREFDTASAALAEAERLAPGDALCALVRAALSVAQRDPNATAMIEAAEAAVEANPLTLLQDDVAALRDYDPPLP